ncbi:MAG TPA: SDR family oxidoreductase [Thermoanaerobaculia bacterium]|nr:SDR family oxidoreductase [Thermoanaerobaculia bacterium]
MRTLVTGHNGYIGSVMVPMLQAAEHEVTGLDTGFFEPCILGGQTVPEIPCIRKDLRDVELADLEGFEAVAHLAGLSNDPLGNLDSSLTFDINDAASIRFARLAKQAGIRRFLFSSSCSTYGAAGDDFLDESAEFSPVTPYATSKVRLEQQLSELADADFSPVYLRNATAYGVSLRLRVDLVLNNLVGWALTTGRIHLMSDGTPWRPLVHIEDISRAFLAVLEAPREAIHDQAFNVGRTSENYRIRELAEIVAETIPGCRITYAEGAGPDKRCYRVDCSKIERLLPAFQPQWDARKGAQELAEAYRKVGLTEAEFLGPRFTRLSRIQELQEEGRIDGKLRWTGPPPVPFTSQPVPIRR